MPREISVRLTDDEIRKLHLPIENRPKTGLNTPCGCPVCKPPIKREPVK